MSIKDVPPRRELEYVGVSAPRASSLDDPDQFTITEDGYRFGKGDWVYNYYDGEWVQVLEDPAAQPRGWFRTSGSSLNSVRVAAFEPQR